MDNGEIVTRMRNQYIAATGLGRISPYPETQGDHWLTSQGIGSCNNENGILFLAYMLVQAIIAGANIAQDKINAANTVRTLERFPGQPGLYNRQPHGYNQRLDSHDNRAGIIAISILNGDTKTPKALISHWWRNKFCFNNPNPGKFSIESFGQPGETALYYIAAGKYVPIPFMLWMLGGIFINGYKQKIDAAQARLTWLRLYCIDTKGVKGIISRFLYKKVRNYWFKKTIKKYGSISAILCFPDGHPVLEFQKIIDKK
tara:strand:+ start:1251 stop:2024 length:774 start_codon:yes stop_codon:yes gene_type:complete